MSVVRSLAWHTIRKFIRRRLRRRDDADSVLGQQVALGDQPSRRSLHTVGVGLASRVQIGAIGRPQGFIHRCVRSEHPFYAPPKAHSNPDEETAPDSSR
jgi:hypothetical protein